VEYGDLISVVIPTYNRARSISRAVEGVLAQTYRDIEVIVVDDASTDESVAIVQRLAEADGRVRLIRQERNGGAARARTAGVAAARAALIAFQDSDDNWLPDKLETQMRLFVSLPDPYVAVFCPEIIYGRDGEGRRKRYGPRRAACVPGPGLAIESGDLSAHFLRANIATLQSMLIKKTAFEAAGGFDLHLRNDEDWDFNIRLSRQGPIGFGEAPLLVVFDSPDGISKNRRASVSSQVRIFSKLRRTEAARTEAGRAVLTAHAVGIARLLLRFGRSRAARRYLGWALASGRFSLGVLLRYAVTSTPGVYGWHMHARRRLGLR
jgi:glycosyltransferase involved in cell wall biosynthesis